MASVVLKMHLSLDGFVSGPNGEADWIAQTQDEALRAWLAETLASAGAHAMGSATFAMMARAWPVAGGSIADAMNSVPKVVFSRTARHAKDLFTRLANSPVASESWDHAEVLSGELATEVAMLKALPCGDVIVHGGVRLARSMIKMALVDEYRLVVHPVALGVGVPLFARARRRVKFELLQRIPFLSGACVHVMREIAAELPP